MFSKIICIAFSLFISFLASTQDLQYAKNVVRELSSEEYLGRGYSGNGINKAAEFIENEFKKNNLQTLNGSYHQIFSVDANTFPGKLKLKINNSQFVAGEDFIIDAASPFLKGTFGVKVIKLREDGTIKDVKKTIRALKNKVLILDERDINVQGDKAKKAYESFVSSLKYNSELKHRALIILTNKKLTWHISSRQNVRPVFLLNTNIDFESIDKVELNVEAELQRNFQTSNIIGYFSGHDQSDSMLVFTAHYDHLGQLGAETYIPGANDNASGVAMLLSLAKYFKENPPKYSVVFIALSAEELGLLGARYFVENPTIDLAAVKFLVNFDLAGTGDEGIKVVNGSIYEKEFQRLTALNLKKNYLPAIRKRGEACISDHCMFYMKGVPCFYIYTLGGIKAYHDIYDRFETLPLTEFEDYTKLMIDFIEGF